MKGVPFIFTDILLALRLWRAVCRKEDKMSDFSPDMEKNNSSKLNTELPDTDADILNSSEDSSASAEEKTTGDTVPYRVSGTDAESGNETASMEEVPANGEAEADAANDGIGTGDDAPSNSKSGQPVFSPDKNESAEERGADASVSGQDAGINLIGPAPASKKGRSKTATYRDKILRHKKRRYRRTIISVVFVMTILVAAIIVWMQRGYTHAELIRIAALTADDAASYENLGGNVVQYGDSGAVCIDQRGNTLWNVNYEMQQPITSVSGDVIAIANRSGYYVYVMNTQGLIGTIRTTLPIHSIAAAENGEVAVIMNDTRATWIRLYSAEGKEIAYLVRTMAENGYPISAAVSPDGETLCLSSVSLSNAAVKTNISFYNFGSSGQKANDHLVQHADFIDEVIPFIHYIDNTTCVCVSDKQLFCFWSTIFHSSGSSSSRLSDNIQGVFYGDSFIGILAANTKGDSQYTLELYNKRGKNAGSVNFTMQYTDIDVAGDKVYIHNEQECQIYTISGRRLFEGKFEKPISAMIPGAGLSDLLVVTDGEVDSVRLH